MTAYSQNGYTANAVDLTKVWEIPGTGRKIRLHSGAPGALLVRFAAWFHAHIEPIDLGQLDDWGFAVRPIRGQDVEYNGEGDAINLSNHASGTAEDLNAVKHSLGVRHTFSDAKAAAIRAELKNYGGCIRWGGDYVKRADEMHFEIVRDLQTCTAVLTRLTTPPKEEDTMAALTKQDLTEAFTAALRAVAPEQAAADYAGEQKLVVADNNYDSQRAVWTSVAQAYAAHLIEGAAQRGAITADELKIIHGSVWSFMRPLWASK